MSRQIPEPNSPRLFASALGAAVTALSLPAAAGAGRPADEPVALDAVTVVGDQQEAYKADESASNKYTAPLRETPKSVTVITDQVIRDTGSLSLVDALRTTSGITFGAGEGGNPAGDRPIIRGFNAESDTFIDGLRDVGSQTREIFNIERIEVSKGPGSAYTGAGSTGGSLNLISKTAKQQDFGDASFTYGSDQTRRYTLDVNRVLADNVAGRLNLLKHEANVAGRDGVEVRRWGVAPTITFGFDTPTRATLSYYHLETDDIPDYGLPLTDATAPDSVRKPVAVDRDNFYGLSNRDYRDSTTDAGTLKLEHDLNDSLTLLNTTRVCAPRSTTSSPRRTTRRPATCRRAWSIGPRKAAIPRPRAGSTRPISRHCSPPARSSIASHRRGDQSRGRSQSRLLHQPGYRRQHVQPGAREQRRLHQPEQSGP